MQQKISGHAQLNCLRMHKSHGVSQDCNEFTFLAFCVFQLPCTLFISGAPNFNKVRNCFPKPLLWKWRFDAAPTEIQRRHSNAFQAFEEIWLRRLSKLNEVQACFQILGSWFYIFHGKKPKMVTLTFVFQPAKILFFRLLESKHRYLFFSKVSGMVKRAFLVA